MSFDRIRTELLDLNGEVRPPATEALAVFEERFSVVLPESAKVAYAIMDGSDYSTDPTRSWIRFWPIQEWKVAGNSLPPGSSEADKERLFLLADYADECVYYAIDLRSESSTFGHIYALGATRVSDVASSFSEFVQLALADSDGLHTYS